MRTLGLTIFFLIFIFSYAKGGEFDTVDKYARSIHKTADYKALTKKLVSSFKTDKEKARAIYVWITDNIRYDWNKFVKGNNKRYHIKGHSKKEIQLKKQKNSCQKNPPIPLSLQGVLRGLPFLLSRNYESH